MVRGSNRLIVDEIVVRGKLTTEEVVVSKSLYVGAPDGASWFMYAGGNSAGLAATSKDAISAFDVKVLSIGASLSLGTGWRHTVAPGERDLQLRLATMDLSALGQADQKSSASMNLYNGGRWHRLRHEGGDKVVWMDK